jgi:hypothetical protein
MTFPCICALYIKLVHLCFSPFYLSPPLIILSTGLNILRILMSESDELFCFVFVLVWGGGQFLEKSNTPVHKGTVYS